MKWRGPGFLSRMSAEVEDGMSSSSPSFQSSSVTPSAPLASASAGTQEAGGLIPLTEALEKGLGPLPDGESEKAACGLLS